MSPALLGTAALKSLNQSLAGSEQRCTNPRSGKEAAVKPQLSRDEHHLLRTCYKGQIIHLILPLPTMFSCQLAFQEPLVQRAANYSRNSNWLLLRQRSNKSKPPAMRVGLAACLSCQPSAGKMQLILPTAHYLGRSCQKTDGGGMEEQEDEDGTRLRERKQRKECG